MNETIKKTVQTIQNTINAIIHINKTPHTCQNTHILQTPHIHTLQKPHLHTATC
jgi:phage-related tail protein